MRGEEKNLALWVMKVSEIPFWRTFFSRDDSNCIFIFSTVNPPYSIAGRTEWPKGIKSHQVFHEPDLEQLAQINFFVEDFGLRGRLLFFVVVAFVFLLVMLLLLLLLLSVSRLNSFLESLIDVSFFRFFFKMVFSFEGWRCQPHTSLFLCTVFFSSRARLFWTLRY